MADTERLPPGQYGIDEFPRFGLRQFARRSPTMHGVSNSAFAVTSNNPSRSKMSFAIFPASNKKLTSTASQRGRGVRSDGPAFDSRISTNRSSFPEPVLSETQPSSYFAVKTATLRACRFRTSWRPTCCLPTAWMGSRCQSNTAPRFAWWRRPITDTRMQSTCAASSSGATIESTGVQRSGSWIIGGLASHSRSVAEAFPVGSFAISIVR